MSALGQKQTCAAHKPMSALHQKRTSIQPYLVSICAISSPYRNGHVTTLAIEPSNCQYTIGQSFETVITSG